MQCVFSAAIIFDRGGGWTGGGELHVNGTIQPPYDRHLKLTIVLSDLIVRKVGKPGRDVDVT